MKGSDPMFSDKYKKETEQLTLDDEFLTKLKQNMRNERERLQQMKGNDETTATKVHDSSDDVEKTYHWKHTLPVALTACAAIALIALFPNIFSNFTSKKDNKISFDTTASNSDTMDTGSLESFQKEELNESASNETFTMDSADESAEYKTEAITESEEESSEDSFADSAPVLEEQNTLHATTSDGVEQSDVSQDVLYEDGTWSYNDNQEFVPTTPELLENLQQRFMANTKTGVAPTIDYADNDTIIFHDYYGLVIYDYGTESIKRLVDLPSRIGDFVTTGKEALQVEFYNNGNYVYLDSHQTDATGGSIGFLYEVSTDTMIQMSKDTLATFDLKADDLSLYTGIDSFASYTDLKDMSSQAIQSKDGKECILYYAMSDDSSVSSLSFCEITKDSDGNITNTRTIPVYMEQ